MGKIKDKWFMVMVSILFIIIVLDMSITLYALNLGFTEGNPIIIYFFEAWGRTTTAIFFVGITFILFIVLIYLREKLVGEKTVRMYYATIGILMSYRAFVVGSWYGIISTYMNGGIF